MPGRNTLRGNDFIAEMEGDNHRTCTICLYNNDGGEYKGNCPYFQDIFGAEPTLQNFQMLDGKRPGNYCDKWTFGLIGED